MKKIILPFSILALLTFSCTKTNPSPTTTTSSNPSTPTKPVVNYGIQYIGSTYSNVGLVYFTDQLSGAKGCNGNKIVLSYVAGDSIHIELISSINFSCVSRTIPFFAKSEDGNLNVYMFKDKNFEINVGETQFGVLLSKLNFTNNNNYTSTYESYFTTSSIYADK